MPRATALVHIGVEKTGTTYLQRLLVQNSETLGEHGVGYPGFLNRSERDANHHALAAYAVDALPEQDIHRFHRVTAASQDRFRADLRDRLRAAVAEQGHDRWVFSSEHLSSRALSRESVQRVADLMGAAGLDPRVVVFVRPQEDMIESTFSTAIVSGRVEPFDFEEAVADRGRYDFRELLERWEDVVGREHITVHAYPDLAEPSALAHMLCAELDVPLEALTLPATRANTSLSYVQAELLRRFTAAARQHPRHADLVRRPALVRALREVGGAPFRLTAAERERVRKEYADTDEWLAERYGVTLRHRGAPGRCERRDVFGGDDFDAFAAALVAGLRRRTRPGRRSGA